MLTGPSSLVIDSSLFGVAQRRHRLFIFGYDPSQFGPSGLTPEILFKTLFCYRADFLRVKGLPEDRAVTVAEALGDLDGETVPSPDSRGFRAGTYLPPNGPFAELMRRGIPSTELPDSHRFSNHKPHTLDFYRRVQKEGRFGRLPRAYLRGLGMKKDKKVLIDPTEPASTITSHPDEFIHFRSPRNISVREMARLQSFPDDFVFHGRYTINGPRRGLDVARCVQVGNAVPPLLAEALGEALGRFSDYLQAGGAPVEVLSTSVPRTTAELRKRQLALS